MSSSAWTEPTDDFAELGEAERCATLSFAATPARLVRARALAFATLLSSAGLTAWSASRIYAVDLGRLPPDHGGAAVMAAGGALLVLLSMRILSWLSHRLADMDASAPLVLRRHELLAGSPPRLIAFADIQSIAPAPPAGWAAAAVQAICDCVFSLLGCRKTSIVRLDIHGQPPVVLDLDLIDGDPHRVERILSYRIIRSHRPSES